MSKKIIIGLALVFVIVSVLIYVMKNRDTNISQPSETLTAVQQQFFTEMPIDNLPQDSTQIPKEDWKKNNPILAFRALKYFEENNLVSASLSQEEIDSRKPVINDWGKPWKVHFLKTELSQPELAIVWKEELALFSESPEEYSEQEKKIEAQLARVKPSVEVDPSQFTTAYRSQTDIDQAIVNGTLGQIKLIHVKTGDNLYTNTKLLSSVRALDEALAAYPGLYEVSSATRALELQALLRKLGYPAAKASYHNVAKAVDFKLSSEAAKNFAALLNTKMPNGLTRMEKIDSLIKEDKYPTMELLLTEKILPRDNPLALAYLKVKSLAPTLGIQVYDETPFFVNFDESGKVKRVAPVLHLQMKD